MNLLSGSFRGGKVTVAPGKLEIAVSAEVAGRLPPGLDRLTLGVRAEDVVVGPGGGLEGRVYGVENHGVEKIVTLKVDEHSLKATVPAHMAIEVDSAIAFAIDLWRAIGSRRSPAAARRVQADGAEWVDGGGATLMPGLVEFALPYQLRQYPRPRIARHDPARGAHAARREAREADARPGLHQHQQRRGGEAAVDVVIRNAINAGQIPGPRLLAATPGLTVSSGLGDLRKLHMPHLESMAIVLDGPEAFRQKVRELIREGVDIVKLVISGDTFVPHAGSHTTVMSEAEVAAAAEVVHAHGKRVAPHARSGPSSCA